MQNIEERSFEDIYRLFMAKSPLLVGFVDKDGNVMELSDSFLIRTGFSCEELLTKSIDSIIEQYPLQNKDEKGSRELGKKDREDEQEKESSLINQIITLCEQDANNNIIERLVLIRRKDNTKFHGLLTCVFLGIVNSKKIFGISITNVSNLVTSREDAINAINDLKKKESLKDEFIAIASHELRTPIQPILGLALLVSRGKISQEEAWKDVLREARRLQQLANDILDVSRIETGSLAFRMDQTNIAEILESVVKATSSSELAREINFRVNIDKELREISGRMDRSRITQLFTNIIGNSVKFTAKGDVTINAKVNHYKDRFEISISDTGGGIPDSILPNLFDKFVTKSVGVSEQHGSGLGLYISKAIVKAHQGAIYACNNNERGATFVIYLPIHGDNQIDGGGNDASTTTTSA